MNQLIFTLCAAIPTAWLLWRRGWIDRKRRFGLVLALVSVFYFIIMRSLPERTSPQASTDPIPTAEQLDAQVEHAARHAAPPPVLNEPFPSSDTFDLTTNGSTRRRPLPTSLPFNPAH
jgi:hypothetical protein